jgi:hypothetical protein
MAKVIESIEQAAELARGLVEASRTKPWCVISTPNGETEPTFRPDDIEYEVDSVCEFFVILGGNATRELENQLPHDTHVFGGAARVYPVGFGSRSNVEPGKVRYVFPATKLQQSTERLTSDIWAAALEAGLLAKPSSKARPVQGKIIRFIGEGGAIAQVDSYTLVTIRQDIAFPGVPLTWVFQIGDLVSGQYDSETRIFTLDAQNPTLQDMVQQFGYRTVTLGLVKATDRKWAKIALHPNLVVEVAKDQITGNPKDVISDYLSVGDVVSVRLYRDAQGKTQLGMLDIDDDEYVAPAVSLVSGGRAWLEEGRDIVDDSEVELLDLAAISSTSIDLLEETEYVPPAAAISTTEPSKLNSSERLHQLAVAHYLARIKVANRKIEKLTGDLNQLARDHRDLQSKHQDLVARSKKLKFDLDEANRDKSAIKQNGFNAYGRIGRFANMDDWFREEVRRAWMSNFSAADRDKFALSNDNWGFSDHFFDNLVESQIDADSLRRAIRAVLFLVTGRNALERNNEAHALLENGKALMRGQDSAMRMHIENNLPQAKRLHYYKLQTGGYELSRIVQHDDFAM